MASRDELLNSINPTMRLTKDFFKRIYGYEITYPGFADAAIVKLESAGCGRAREYYNLFADQESIEYEAVLKSVAKWERERFRKTVVERKVKNEYIQEGEKNWDSMNLRQKRYTGKQKSDLLKNLQKRNQSA